MTAKGKINASQLSVNDRIIIKIERNDAGLMTGWHESATKTGEDVMVSRVTAKFKAAGRRGYVIMVADAGTDRYMEPIQTMWLAPEDPAGIKRAWAEALELDKVYEAYPLAETEPETTEPVADADLLAALPASVRGPMAEVAAIPMEVIETQADETGIKVTAKVPDATALVDLQLTTTIPGLDPSVRVPWPAGSGDQCDAAATDTTWRVEFERIGRRHEVAPLEIVVPRDRDWNLAQELAEAVYRYASGFLTSQWFDVTVDVETGQVYVEAGRFGSGKLTKVQ